jgi:hypothetical protein
MAFEVIGLGCSTVNLSVWGARPASGSVWLPSRRLR